MKIKSIAALSTIGIISLLYVNEKSKNYVLHQQSGHLQTRNDYYKRTSGKHLASKKNELNELKSKFTERQNGKMKKILLHKNS